MKAMTYPVVTYPEMDKEIVSLLKLRGGSASLYAAARIEGLEAETTQLLEQAQRAGAEAKEAVAREAALIQALEIVWKERKAASYEEVTEAGVTGWAFYLDEHKSKVVRDALQDRSTAANALLERLAELETQVADLRAALQAALTPLERAADALVPPGARVEEAAALVDEALAAIREDLE